jgi:hypothetical protein
MQSGAPFFLSPLLRHIDVQGDDQIGKNQDTKNNCLPVGDHCTARFRSEELSLSRITRKSGLLCKTPVQRLACNWEVKCVSFRGANYGTRLRQINTQ